MVSISTDYGAATPSFGRGSKAHRLTQLTARTCSLNSPSRHGQSSWRDCCAVRARNPARERITTCTPSDCVSAADTGKPLFLLEQVTPSPSCVHFRCISGVGISRHPRNPTCARAVLSMSDSEANDAPFRVVFFAPSFASRNANADGKISLSRRAETRLRDAFGCRPLQGVAPPYGRLGQSSRGTIGSRRFHPL